MKLWKTWAAAAVSVWLVAGCGGGSSSSAADPVALKVLSSTPQYVSGGDARIEVAAPSELHGKLEFWLNGKKIAPSMRSDGNRLEGLVVGLAEGVNKLELRRLPAGDVAASLQLTNYPISGPMFSGPQQEPFVCTTKQIDNAAAGRHGRRADDG